MFASFFKGEYKQDSLQCSELFENEPAPIATIRKLELSINDVYKTLLSMNTRMGAGPDGLPNIFFSFSLHNGTFPTAYVCAIHKDGPRSAVSKYWPICIQFALAKLFKNVVFPQLTAFFKNIISSKQHGFVGGRSTTSNLFLYINYLLEALNNGQAVHTVYTDFSKAFDRVDHHNKVTHSVGSTDT